MSTDGPYDCAPRRSSGGLYQRVITLFVIDRELSRGHGLASPVSCQRILVCIREWVGILGQVCLCGSQLFSQPFHTVRSWLHKILKVVLDVDMCDPLWRRTEIFRGGKNIGWGVSERSHREEHCCESWFYVEWIRLRPEKDWSGGERPSDAHRQSSTRHCCQWEGLTPWCRDVGCCLDDNSSVLSEADACSIYARWINKLLEGKSKFHLRNSGGRPHFICGTENFIPGRSARPVKSWSIYSNTM